MSLRMGFDIDGTVDSNLDAFRAIAEGLIKTGHEVWVITGGLADSGEWTLQARIELLKKFKFPYSKLVRCIAPTMQEIAKQKRQVCEEHGITMMFEDNDLYISEIAQVCTTLKVVN